MSNLISSARRKFGEGFLSLFPDGTSIPWKPLRLKDFLEYETQFREGRVSSALLEDEIFKKCVLDKHYVLNASLLNAGLVTTVVSQIMEISGPGDAEQITRDLNIARHSTSNFFCDGAAQIAQVFPAYTIEDVLKLPYFEFLETLSLAERRLLQMGILQEPISIVGVEKPKPQKKVQFANLNPVPDPYMPPPPKPSKKVVEKEIVISGANNILDKEIVMSLQGHDQMDVHLWKRDAVEGLELIYPELFKKMKSGEKITPDLIRKTKGESAEEIKQKHKEYTEELMSGKIEHKASSPLIAHGRDENPRPRVKRKR